jgi:hypothetical protein
MAGMRRSLSAGTLTGLYFNNKYRFLTIQQFAKIAGFSRYHSAEILRDLERWGFVGYFGYIGIPGHGKTPKVYYLKRKGWELLCSEGSPFDDMTEPFMEVHKEITWTPQMYHRLRIIDLLLSAEIAIRNRPHLTMAKPFLEYRMVKKGHSVARETTDFVDTEEISENKLVPDAAFILENIETQRRALFFVEMDMATERIVSRIPRDIRSTLHHKIAQYDRYLKSRRYVQTYAPYGEFRFFTLLFITLGDQRLENMRHALQDLPADLAKFYRLTTYDQAMGDFLGPVWKSRLLTDTALYPLVAST